MKLREWMYSIREICHDVASGRSDKLAERRIVEGGETHQLIGQEEDGLETELPVAEVEQVLERGAQKVNDHGIVVAFRPEPTDKGDANATSKRLVDLRLVLKLGVLRLDRLKLDGDFLPGDDVDSEVDVTYTCHSVQDRWQRATRRTERARTNLLAQPVLSTYAEVEAVRRRIGHRYVDCMR